MSDYEVERNEKEEPEEAKRGEWGGQFEFIVTSLGYAVGLGNVWRFPNLVYRHGGGAFLFVYFLLLFILAVPLILMESSLGQFSSLGPVAVWKMMPVGKGIGIGILLNAFILSVYYNSPIAYSAYYFVHSFQNPLPWTTCTSGNDTCTQFPNANSTLLSPAEDFFYNKCLKVSDGIEDMNDMNWDLLLANACVWILIFLVISKGAESLGKVAYFTSLFPYVMLTAILIQASLLDGAYEGVLFYLGTDFSKLSNPELWKDALTAVFISTGVASGGVVTLASYNKFNNNIVRDSIIIPILDGLTGFYAGFCVFTVLGFLAHKTDKPIAEVVEEGPGLIFITYPEALALMPGSYVWAALFFFMCCTLGMSSQFPQIETMCNVMGDQFPIIRKNAATNIAFRFLACLVAFSFGIIFYTDAGYYWFYMFDDKIITYPIMILTVIESLGVGWLYGGWNLKKDIVMMTNVPEWVLFPFQFVWMLVAPIIIGGIFIWEVILFSKPETLDYTYPDWTIAFIWGVVAIPVLAVPITGIVVRCCTRGDRQTPDKFTCSNFVAPDRTWGPHEPVNWYGRYESLNEVFPHKSVYTPAQLLLLSQGNVTKDQLTTAREVQAGVANNAFESDSALDKRIEADSQF